MPQLLIAALTPYVGATTATVVVSAATAAAALGLSAITAQKQEAMKPEDGRFNLRQNVPSMAFVLGRAKKGGDYLLLEQTGRDAWHVICYAGHRVHAFPATFLHDELIAVNGTGRVTTPTHFGGSVQILDRFGLPAETVYAELIAAMPTIWTADHRGDGLATMLMRASSKKLEDQPKTFPNDMPLPTRVIEGAYLFDPRQAGHNPADELTWGYSENLALERLWHLTHPVGGKLTLADMHLPDWANAANVCDQMVTNRQGVQEPRYHGGMSFRAGADQVQVGRLLDEAAEMILYERPDGKIGVHAGEYVEPDVRLDADDLISVRFDANRRLVSSVLAVRGRYTATDKRFNTVDAAIVGQPYIPEEDSTQRTRTVDNQAVQRHNHIQRLQTLKMLRLNAPKVKVLAHYEPAKKVPYRRFVRVHFPPRLNEAVIELTGRPVLSLRNLTIEFEGVVLPGNIYPFDAAIQEGDPPPVIIELESGGVPTPTGFGVTIQREAVADTLRAAFALAAWTLPTGEDATDPIIETEIEFEIVGEPATIQSVRAKPGETAKRTPYLADGKTYRFRARHWSQDTSSNWTTPYVTVTAVSDPTPPASPVAFQAPLSGTTVAPSARAANDNTRALIFKRGTAAQSFADATVIGDPAYITTANQPISLTDAPGLGHWRYWVTARNGSGILAAAPAGPIAVDIYGPERVSNGDFASDTIWTKGAGWGIASGVATKTAGGATSLAQAVTLTAGGIYEVTYTVTSLTAGTVISRFLGGTVRTGTTRSTAGTYTDTITAATGNNTLDFLSNAAGAFSIDNVSVKQIG